MEALASAEALTRHVAAIARGAEGYTTNLFAAPEQLARWTAAGSLRVLPTEGAVLVLRRDRAFDRVYHVAESPRALTTALSLLPPGSYTADLVGRDGTLDAARASYVATGFADRTFLCRMTRTQTPGANGAGDAALAAADDAAAVAAFLERLLDPLAEQLPDEDELGEAAREGRLLLVRHGEAIAGMLMYDFKGQLAHLRFWHVDTDARGAGVGRQLMGAFLTRCAAARRIVLWVIGDNERSIAIYRHYGFAPDGLIDRVLVLDKEA